ncbi:NYN domain-containing protein [Sphingomonas sp.]|uniref:NYN domain-containing protein n=1 Tax=Sphingomonas sp. TaxID=28214 RepID=UPI0025CE763A|nr:NYN domain-containing protein [Sphingomonas sp.]
MKPRFAVLLDGGFLKKKLLDRLQRHPTADDIITECDRLRALPCVDGHDLLRIYYYDAFPASTSLKKPVTRAVFNMAETERFRESQSLYNHLVLKPDIALRMGQVSVPPTGWKPKAKVVRELIKTPRELTDDDFVVDAQQKGVDMRIGMDMARLALRDMVRTVIVVTGDSDFIPAFKFVRREGVRVVLDLLGENGRIELKQHSDLVL